MAEQNNLLDNLRTIVRTAREVGITVYHVPHHRWEPGDYLNWKYPSPYQLGAAERLKEGLRNLLEDLTAHTVVG
jgi:hypothetical protein